MNLPKMNRNIGIYYKNPEWGREVFEDFFQLYKNRIQSFSRINFNLRTIDGTSVNLINGKNGGGIGRRFDVVLMEKGLPTEAIEKMILPTASLGRKEVFVWDNEWKRYLF